MDISDSFEQFACLKGQGKSFATIRAYLSTGSIDPNVIINLRKAAQANLTTDVYIDPCVSCNDAYGSVKTIVNALKNENIGTFWVKIYINTWMESASRNKDFITSLIGQMEAQGISKDKIGILTSKFNWDRITNYWDAMSGYKLWYISDNGVNTFEDFVSFGGWTTPYMKQYDLLTPECGRYMNFDIK